MQQVLVRHILKLACLHEDIVRFYYLLSKVVIFQLLAHEGIGCTVELRHRLIMTTFLYGVEIVSRG